MQGIRQRPILTGAAADRVAVVTVAIAGVLSCALGVVRADGKAEVSRAADAGAISVFGEGDATPLVTIPSALGPWRYMPGRGLHVGQTGLTLGGYSSINLERDEGGPARLRLDDLSFFGVWDPLPTLHIFSETELEDALEVDDHGRGGTVHNTVSVERLYGDLAIADGFNLRGGQFLTPVGRWNVIHAQPLVWTTSRPLATLLPFAPQTTGAMLFGTFFPDPGRLTYGVYGQFVNALDAEPHAPQAADRSAGARVEFAVYGGPSLGASYNALTHAGRWQHLGGLDLLWQGGPVEVMGEFVYADAAGDAGAQWGLYLQNVIEVHPRFYLVGRYEYFAQRAPQPAVNLISGGIAYKPAPYIVLKAEYLVADHPAEVSPPGFKSSFALLF